ncbi:MAG: V-type ATP synthase subunit I [Thermodesulfobacteriota bacterium]
MAIVAMLHATLIGPAGDKDRVLAALQHIGCLHLISDRTGAGGEGPAVVPSRAMDAFSYLKNVPDKRRQLLDHPGFSLPEVRDEALEIKEKILALEAEREYLLSRIANLRPWGDFRFPELAETGGQRFWFYTAPLYRLDEFARVAVPWECVHRDHRNAYIVAVSPEEPPDMPVARTHTGSRSLAVLEGRLEEVESELEDLHWRRFHLTRWLTLFARELAAAEDQDLLLATVAGIADDGELFSLEGWLPAGARQEMERVADSHSLVLLLRPPAENETPPTQLADDPTWQGGQELVAFYTMPGYELWDPSRPVLVSFVLFFAMIVGDAGYGILLACLLLLYRRRLAAASPGMRNLLFATAGATVGYGILAGSYFGLVPPPGSPAARLQLFSAAEQGTMMTLSIAIGTVHLLIANGSRLLLARRRDGLQAAGWMLVLAGGFLLWRQQIAGALAGQIVTIAGLAVILLAGGKGPYSRDWIGLGRRLLDGVIALTALPKAFGDVLSYLRLFALGLASTKLAETFNLLAAEANREIAGMGTLIGVLVISFGHGLNFLLAVMSGVVHGLRLNFIEFFNWGMPEEGYPFKPFCRRRIRIWNQF